MTDVDLKGITPYLGTVVSNNGSDLHLRAGKVPRIRVDGNLVSLDVDPVSAEDVARIVLATMPVDVKERFEATNEADYAIVAPKIGRFRANAFKAMGGVCLIARHVKDEPATLADLGLPEVLSDLSLEPRGLVLVTGPTGSGKTTTLGAMVDLINERRSVHILTIEDPIEIMHTDKMASVNQRELHTDTADFKVAMKAAMREDPDVILVGEMRDAETVSAALAAAKTGHFVMSTLHTTDAAKTINRIIDFFPADEQQLVRADLAESLKGVVCQRLLPTKEGTGRTCVMEILVSTPRIEQAIADPNRTHEITDIVNEGAHYGMRTFDQHLLDLVLNDVVSIESALRSSSNSHDLGVQLKRAGIKPDVVDRAELAASA